VPHLDLELQFHGGEAGHLAGALVLRLDDGHVHWDDGGQNANSHADGGDKKREEHGLGDRESRDIALDDKGGASGLSEGAEQVSTHACDITHIVTNVIGDNGGVALVVLGKTLLHFADKIGANI
jgi:hypothetical protein